MHGTLCALIMILRLETNLYAYSYHRISFLKSHDKRVNCILHKPFELNWSEMLFYYHSYICVPVPSQNLDFLRHISWSLLTFNELNWEEIVRFVDIDGIADPHCLTFFSFHKYVIIYKNCKVDELKFEFYRTTLNS